MGRCALAPCLAYCNQRSGIEGYTTVTESPRPQALLILRFLSFLVSAFTVFIGPVITDHFYLLFLTHWGAIATAVYFTLALAAYTHPQVRPVAYIGFETAVVMEVLVTLGFWATVYPFMDTSNFNQPYNYTVHGGLLTLLLLDFALNRIRFVPKHYCVCTVVLAVYCVVNVSAVVAIQPIYPLITFTDVTTYIVILVIFLFGYLSHRVFGWLDRFKPASDLPEARFELGPILKA